jgi:lipoyl-dependent peroxiredoxin
VVARKAEAEWKGDLPSGDGTMKLGSGAWSGAYSFRSRFESGEGGTNPEELIGAALAGCFSMALSHGLASAGHKPERVHTVAHAHLEKTDGGFAITRVELKTEARVPGIDEGAFQQQAATAKANCPVSKALGAIQIDLDARLT